MSCPGQEMWGVGKRGNTGVARGLGWWHEARQVCMWGCTWREDQWAWKVRTWVIGEVNERDEKSGVDTTGLVRTWSGQVWWYGCGRKVKNQSVNKTGKSIWGHSKERYGHGWLGQVRTARVRRIISVYRTAGSAARDDSKLYRSVTYSVATVPIWPIVYGSVLWKDTARMQGRAL